MHEPTGSQLVPGGTEVAAWPGWLASSSRLAVVSAPVLVISGKLLKCSLQVQAGLWAKAASKQASERSFRVRPRFETAIIKLAGKRIISECTAPSVKPLDGLLCEFHAIAR